MPYLKLPHELIKRKDLSLLDKCLYAYILSFKLSYSPFKAHISTLADFFNVSESSIKRSLKTLLRSNLLVKNEKNDYEAVRVDFVDPVPRSSSQNVNINYHLPREVPVPRWYQEYRHSVQTVEDFEVSEQVKKETFDFMRDFFKDE